MDFIPAMPGVSTIQAIDSDVLALLRSSHWQFRHDLTDQTMSVLIHDGHMNVTVTSTVWSCWDSPFNRDVVVTDLAGVHIVYGDMIERPTGIVSLLRALWRLQK
jgi:hypothetical protein